MVPFTDPYIGYSFSYPESWFFDPPRGPTQFGWAGILTSWNTVGLERPPDGTVVKKIDIMTSPNSQHRTLDEFLASLDPENVTVLSSEAISLGGIPANRQEIFLHNTESHLTAITAVHGDWIFQINAYWEPYDVLQLVLDSFRFEESP